jgi:hypothetical protein
LTRTRATKTSANRARRSPPSRVSAGPIAAATTCTARNPTSHPEQKLHTMKRSTAG